MSIITRSQLTATADNRRGYKSFSQILNETKLQSRYSATVTVFLSHSHKDKDEVEKAVVFLRGLGIVVYVDWMDDSMPETTSGVTAARIKQKIDENKKFILLATNTAIASKWCNWELGYGDSKKYVDNIALFPVADTTESDWKGNEYLQIYPRIEVVNGSYYVIYPNRTKTVLIEQWLRS